MTRWEKCWLVWVIIGAAGVASFKEPPSLTITSVVLLIGIAGFVLSGDR